MDLNRQTYICGHTNVGLVDSVYCDMNQAGKQEKMHHVSKNAMQNYPNKGIVLAGY